MVPIAAPIALGMGFDLSHFGIVTVLAVEIGLLTPPFGISVFTVHSTLDDPNVSIEQVFSATLPFVGVMLLVLLLVALSRQQRRFPPSRPLPTAQVTVRRPGARRASADCHRGGFGRFRP